MIGSNLLLRSLLMLMMLILIIPEEVLAGRYGKSRSSYSFRDRSKPVSLKKSYRTTPTKNYQKKYYKKKYKLKAEKEKYKAKKAENQALRAELARERMKNRQLVNQPSPSSTQGPWGSRTAHMQQRSSYINRERSNAYRYTKDYDTHTLNSQRHQLYQNRGYSQKPSWLVPGAVGVLAGGTMAYMLMDSSDAAAATVDQAKDAAAGAVDQAKNAATGAAAGAAALAATNPSTQWLYHHWEDPSVIEWRAQMEEQAKNNPELKARLESMEMQIAAMQATGLARDSNFTHKDVPPHLLYAKTEENPAETKKAGPPKLRLCTARAGNYYDQFGQAMSQAMNSVQVDVIHTQGTFDNLKRINKSCDAALVQRNGYVPFAKENAGLPFAFERVGSMFSEVAHLICSEQSGVDSEDDLESDKYTVNVGSLLSGTNLLWQDLTKHDTDFQATRVDHSNLTPNLLKLKMKNNDISCAVHVSALRSPFMMKLNRVSKDAQLKLVPFDDSDFGSVQDPAGKDVYTFMKIPSNTYDNLQSRFFGGVKTVSLPTDLIVSKQWIEQNPENFDRLIDEVQQISNYLAARSQ
ncbi:hypothetical protein ACQZV8_06775 [Magnetococcales bacterium HHB-1]